MEKNIVLYHHLGLGDHFICNGLVTHFSETCHLHLPCKVQYLQTIQSLYQDNTNVTVFPIFNEHQDVQTYANSFDLPIITVGFQNLGEFNTVWYKSFYRQHDIPYEYRYEKFTLPTSLSGSQKLFDSLDIVEPYAVVHDTSGANSSGYPMNLHFDNKIKRVIKINPQLSKNMLDWITVIKHASEIHVVPSSVFCMVDSIATSLTARLYYHDLRANTNIDHADIERPDTNWKVIKYDRQL